MGPWQMCRCVRRVRRALENSCKPIGGWAADPADVLTHGRGLLNVAPPAASDVTRLAPGTAVCQSLLRLPRTCVGEHVCQWSQFAYCCTVFCLLATERVRSLARRISMRCRAPGLIACQHVFTICRHVVQG